MACLDSWCLHLCQNSGFHLLVWDNIMLFKQTEHSASNQSHHLFSLQHRSSSWQMQVCVVLWETPWFSHNVTSVWNNIGRFQMRSIPSLQSWKFIWGWNSIWWHLLTLYQQNYLLSSSGLTISTLSSSKSSPISISCAWLGEGLVAPLQCGFCLIYCLVQHQQISDKIPSFINLNLLVTLPTSFLSSGLANLVHLRYLIHHQSLMCHCWYGRKIYMCEYIKFHWILIPNSTKIRCKLVQKRIEGTDYACQLNKPYPFYFKH